MLTVTHDPHAKLPYGWNWAGWLAGDPLNPIEGDTLTAATITVLPTAAATVTNKTVSPGGMVSCVVAATASCRITCHAVSAQGFEDDRFITLSVRDR